METEIKQINDVEYELEITASADELADDLKAALRRQRNQTVLKGFRPGKVPLGLVKKMHGRALAFGIAEQKVQETFRSEVVEKDEYDVIGLPQLTTLDYDIDDDLRAVVRFGVRPEVDLKDLSEEKVSRLKREVVEEDIEKQLERIRRDNAEIVPAPDEPIEENFHVVVDLQQIDEASNTPIIGEREENVEFFVDDERLHEELRDELLGKKEGDVFRVDLPHGSGDHVHTHRYEVTVKEVKRRELPDLDDAFVGEYTKDRLTTVDELREEIRQNLENAWKEQIRELLESKMVERMLELHPIAVPASAVEMYLDSFLSDVKQRNEGKLPPNFDEEAFREANRGEAEKQARWMLIRDALIRQDNLEVSDEDLDDYFEKAASGSSEISAEMLRRYYQTANMMDGVKQQILSRKVFDRLEEMFEIEDKELDELQEEDSAGQEEPSSPIITPVS